MAMNLSVSRFAGGHHDGRLRIGAISANGALGSRASIPSKFETVLNTASRENNAFGRRTARFDEPENELPGPGAYLKKRSILKSTAAVSSNGTAAFASAIKAGFSSDAPVFVTPGPGLYDPVHPSRTVKVTSAFAPPCAKPQVKVKVPSKPVPGPGAYDIEKCEQKPVCFAFTSKSSRSSDDAAGRKGRQQDRKKDDEQRLTESPTAGSSKSPPRQSHYYASNTERFSYNAAKPADRQSLPPALHETAESQLKLPSIIFDEAPRSSPGRVAPAEALEKKSRRTSAFADSLLDRFGSPTQRYSAQSASETVGPGSYDVEPKQKRLLISSSWALSGVSRSQTKGKYVPPGPAFYSPQFPSSRISHHAVNRDFWL